MLTAQALTKRFGDHLALDGLDLHIAPGEVFCLLGANGAGKSTTIKLFLGFLAPTAGRALVDGVEVAADPIRARSRLLYIPEQVALHEELTGLENLVYFARLGAVPDASPRRLTACLEEAGLAPTAVHRRVSGYSKGMRQKVGVALAIAKGAKALLLDEPTSGLDPQASADFHDLVARQRDAGAAVLMATHDLFRARQIADRVGVMRGGKLRLSFDAQELSAQDLEAVYLQAMVAEPAPLRS
ncbi:ABC transporter ATP-binding protein [Phenylobacterium deserti]|uniref:ABC transporter ATP-binding protein n=1 Tax=Phenylobacterium deserti TaxID=1914756 RepID=A0A328AC01_9CAUL|nr:ABC transporter ATP-binding protein [Phenylobacterium deserti]RAK52191.1 ABC transporter ATP-binding protein [Phenylobacterium deserti]